MLKKSQFFYFTTSFLITFVVGFFIWNIFINPDSSILTQVLVEANKIRSGIFVASISSSLQTESMAPEEVPDQLAEQDENLLEPDDVISFEPVESVQDQLDDIQEKLDIIQQQVNELITEQNKDKQPELADKEVAKDDEKKQEKMETAVCTGQININTASAEDLDKLIDVGLPTAQKIISARPYYLLDDLLKASGIGPATLQEIKDQGCAYVEPGLAPPASGGGGGGSATITYPKILISEVQTQGLTDSKEEFVELYNPNDQAINLTSWYLQKRTNGGSISYFGKKSLFYGYKIPANGYFVVARDGYFESLADIWVDTALSDNSSLIFSDPNDVISDEVSWPQIADGLSWCYDFSLCSPTPGAPNIAYVEPLAPTLQSIAITNSATKLIYTVGDALDIAGLVVTGAYSDSSTQIEPITLDNITSFDSSTPSTGQVLTITFGGKTTNYTITVNPIVVSPSITSYTFNGVVQNITVNPVTNPIKIDFTASESVEWTSLKIENQNDSSIYKSYSFSSSCDGGLICSQAWDGGISPSGKTLIDGIYKLKIHIINSSDNTKSFYDYLAPYTITVDSTILPPPGLASITITIPATKLNYNIGEVLDISGLVVTGTYSDGSTQIEAITSEDVSGFNSSAEATGQVLTITFGGQTVIYTVDVAMSDATPPTVLSFYPSDDSVDVAVDVQPTLIFSEPIDPTTMRSANIQLREYAVSASDATPVSAALTLDFDRVTVGFYLSSPLQYDKKYYFFVGSNVKDIAGNSFAKNTWYHLQRDQHEFTTLIDTTSPSD